MKKRGHQAPTFEAVEPRLLMSGNTLMAEAFASAEMLNVRAADSVSVEGEIGQLNQQDMYHFTAPARGWLYINTEGVTRETGASLEVYDSLGRLRWRRSAEYQVRLYVVDGQDYYVKLSGENVDSNYQLRVTSDPFDDYGNTIDNALQLRTYGGRTRRFGQVNYSGDTDMISLLADKTGLMEVNGLNYNHLWADLDIVAYDQWGNVLAQSASAGQSVSFDVVAGQQIYLSAANDQGQTGYYILNVQTTVDEMIRTAQTPEIVPAATTSLQGDLSLTGRQDMYKITAPALGWMDLNVSGQGYTPTVEVYDSSGRLRYRDWNGNGNIRMFTQPGQELYVMVASGPHQQGQYTLDVTSTPLDDHANNFAGARTYRVGPTGIGRGFGRINYSGDVDMYSFIAGRDGTMVVDTWDYNGRGVETALSAYNESGELLASNVTPGGEISFSVTQGQQVYVAATNVNTGFYLIQIETNDTPAPPPPVPTPEPTPEPFQYAPGSSISTDTYDTGNGWQLVIKGTEQSDFIYVSQDGATVSLRTAAGTQQFTGDWDGVTIYGFSGGDHIQVDHTVSLDVNVLAGAGNDAIYMAGSGNDTVHGESGNNLMVSVGGGADVLRGGTGFDSFWGDSSDEFRNVAQAEVDALAVHSIAEFHQPVTSDSNASGYVDLTPMREDLVDPQATSYARGWANFSHIPLFSNGIDMTDIRQGGVGDCYFLATLASYAQQSPEVIQQMIVPLGDGTYAMRYFDAGNEVYLRVDADLPVLSNGQPAYAKFGSDVELWVALAEKGFAQLRDGVSTYASISGGWMTETNRLVTGNSSTTVWTTGTTTGSLFDWMNTQLTAGTALTAATWSSASGPIISSHGYVVYSLESAGAEQYVTLYNPWGFDGTSYDSNPSDGLVRISMAQFKTNFSAVIGSAA